MQSESTESAARPAQQADADTANGLATGESGASSQSIDTAAVGTGQDGAAGADASRSDGADTSSADAAAQAGHQIPAEATGGDALAENAAATTGAGSSEGGSSLSAAQSDSHRGAAQAATDQDLSGTAGGTQAGTSALSEEAARAAGAAAQAAADGTSSAATGAEGGAGLDQGAAAAGAGAGQASSGASEGGAALSREQTTPRDGQTARQEEVIVGLVEAPGKKATPTETVIPQTLGGMLPMTLGVEGEGEFDFDKAVLREQVRSVLDELATKLKSADYDRLEIVGHTDRIGTDAYNQYLSERRAWAVARYLIQQGVPVTKVAVEGRGMHEPVTAAEACAGLGRAETIACLQDDRRVVISASIRRVDVNVH
jgi:outer membrane protein OmpA-like peptidoglycan-associated protein